MHHFSAAQLSTIHEKPPHAEVEGTSPVVAAAGFDGNEKGNGVKPNGFGDKRETISEVESTSPVVAGVPGGRNEGVSEVDATPSRTVSQVGSPIPSDTHELPITPLSPTPSRAIRGGGRESAVVLTPFSSPYSEYAGNQDQGQPPANVGMGAVNNAVGTGKSKEVDVQKEEEKLERMRKEIEEVRGKKETLENLKKLEEQEAQLKEKIMDAQRRLLVNAGRL